MKASELAQDIKTNGERLVSKPDDTGARAALVRDSGFLVGDQGYRAQVLAEIRQLGVMSVENSTGTSMGISIYADGTNSSQIEIVKGLPGTHPVGSVMGDSIGKADGKEMEMPNFREVLVKSSPGKLFGTNTDVTIWENDRQIDPQRTSR